MRPNESLPALQPAPGKKDREESISQPEIDWEKLCAKLKPNIDHPALLELQTTLGCPPQG
jgi:hypothetical protein